jgi:hypothetical protein
MDAGRGPQRSEFTNSSFAIVQRLTELNGVLCNLAKMHDSQEFVS